MLPMPSAETFILEFVNHSSGTFRVGETGVSLHWDLLQQLAWLGRCDDGEKVLSTEAEYHEFKDLWATLLSLISAFVDCKSYQADDLTRLNSWAGRINLVPRLENEGLVYSCHGFADACTWIAVQAVYFLGTANPKQIRRCAGCQKIFLDPSPTQRKKWCAMRTCGNRAKVRAFNQRKMLGASD